MYLVDYSLGYMGNERVWGVSMVYGQQEGLGCKYGLWATGGSGVLVGYHYTYHACL